MKGILVICAIALCVLIFTQESEAGLSRNRNSGSSHHGGNGRDTRGSDRGGNGYPRGGSDRGGNGYPRGGSDRGGNGRPSGSCSYDNQCSGIKVCKYGRCQNPVSTIG